MNIADLLDEFNVVIDTAEGLTELRSLILGLAIRGKLIPQDPNDEPASELLKKIEAEKKQLYEIGEIRKPKKTKTLDEENFEFNIPENWEGVQLGVVVDNYKGKKPSHIQKEQTDFPYLSNSFLRTGQTEDYTVKEDESAKIIDDKGLIIVWDGSRSGEVFYSQIGALSSTQAYIKIIGVNREFLYYFLNTKFEEYNTDTTGAAIPHLNRKVFEGSFLPLPPLAEQHRIVKKIESLFAEVDELEAKLNRQTKLDEKLQLAVNAEVQQAPDAEASKSVWNFITSNFDTLYHTPEAIINLKKNILNEAVRGRLVPQNPNDESASELLKKIEAEKERLYKEGEIRKPKDLPPVEEDEIPFEIPECWEWVKMKDTYLDSFYGPRFNKNEYVEEGIPTIRTTDFDDYGGVMLKDPPKVKVSRDKKELYLLKENDLIITRSGSVGEMAIYDLEIEAIPSAYLIRFRPSSLMYVWYVYFYLKSSIGQDFLGLNTNTTAQPNISGTSISKILFPLPPLEEQHRIVRRIEELFAICDRFKAQLEQRQAVNERLVKGLVGEVLEGR